MPVSKSNYQNYTTIIYQLDEVKKTFRQYKKQGQELQQTVKEDFFPGLIRIEQNNGYNTFSGLNNLLRLRDASNWSVCTKLGLKPTGISNYYSTNIFVENKKKLCIVCYFKDNQSVELNVFPEFYPCKKSELTEKVKELTQSIAHKKGI
jgi:hypothetical protein